MYAFCSNNPTTPKPASCYSSTNNFLKDLATWSTVALLVTSVVFGACAVFGGLGIFAGSSSLPQWLAQSVSTVGYKGCMAMFAGGCTLGGITLFVSFCVTTVAIVCSKIKNAQNNTALTRTAGSGNTEIVKALLAQDGINVNAQDIYGYTALIRAARRDDAEAVKALLAQDGIDVNAQGNDGYTALIWAATNDNTEVVKALLAQDGIKFNAQNENGATALILAAANDNTEALKALLDKDGIDVHAQCGNGKTALIFAARNGNTEVVKALLAQDGINVNAQGNDGATALILAAANGYTEAVKALLAQDGIKVYAQDARSNTSLIIQLIKIAKSYPNLKEEILPPTIALIMLTEDQTTQTGFFKQIDSWIDDISPILKGLQAIMEIRKEDTNEDKIELWKEIIQTMVRLKSKYLSVYNIFYDTDYFECEPNKINGTIEQLSVRIDDFLDHMQRERMEFILEKAGTGDIKLPKIGIANMSLYASQAIFS